MEARSTGTDRHEGWTIHAVETLLSSLNGVISVRLVARPGGEIDEIHLLTTMDVGPKQTVRNVESALMAHFDLEVDHRKISVAQSSQAIAVPPPAPEPTQKVAMHPISSKVDGRILFVGHQIESERSQRLCIRVTVEWNGERRTGEASGADMPRGRLEIFARATLQAVQRSLDAGDESQPGVELELEGVKLVEAFDRQFVLVAVHALDGREIGSLSGAATVEDSLDRAVILGTLQATDRWVRGRA